MHYWESARVAWRTGWTVVRRLVKIMTFLGLPIQMQLLKRKIMHAWIDADPLLPSFFFWTMAFTVLITVMQKFKSWISHVLRLSLRQKKATMHQVTTTLATFENVLFPGHKHLLTTSTDDPSLDGTQVITKVLGHQYRWLAGGYDLEIGV